MKHNTAICKDSSRTVSTSNESTSEYGVIKPIKSAPAFQAWCSVHSIPACLSDPHFLMFHGSGLEANKLVRVSATVVTVRQELRTWLAALQ